MSTETNNSGEEFLGEDLLKVLNSMGQGEKINYLEIGRRSGLAGTELDGGLERLEHMGRIRSERLRDQMQYWRTPPAPAQNWYTVDEAAQYLRVSRRTVYQLVKEKLLTPYRVRGVGHRRFKQEDMDGVMQKEQDISKSTLRAADDPVLAELWNNDNDAAYDRL